MGSTGFNFNLMSGKVPRNPAVVLGMFETGLAVGRSLRRAGVRVVGLDSAKKIGFCSNCIEAKICPHPVEHEGEFVEFLIDLAGRQDYKPVLFITSDEFLMPVSRNLKRLEQYYLSNLPAGKIIAAISDKWKQYELCLNTGVPAPRTFLAENLGQLQPAGALSYPLFVKGREVNSWRKIMGVDQKGFVVNTPEELDAILHVLSYRGVCGLVQEVIPGSDSNHFKACCYIGVDGEVLLSFALRKIRQQPVGFGFGCLVESIHYPELLELAQKFFTGIGYRGVGSVEFKLDGRTSELKFIELNPRYWQQNGLPDKCGMNFPLMNFLDVTGCRPRAITGYREGVKWVNLYCDFDSFREYQKLGTLSLEEWIQSLRGPKVYSDFATDDVGPFLYELRARKVFPRLFSFAGRAVKRGLQFRGLRSKKVKREGSLARSSAARK